MTEFAETAGDGEGQEPADETLYTSEAHQSSDDPEAMPGHGEPAPPPEQPAEEQPLFEQETAAMQPPVEEVAAPMPSPSDEASSAEPGEEAAEPQPEEQAAQDALFTAEPLAPEPVAAEEGVTSFGGAPDDLDVVRADLQGTEAEGGESVPAESEEQPGEQVLEMAGAGVAEAVAAAQEDAETEAAEAIAEAGVPAGSDDDPEAVEALLDAEIAEGLVEPRDRTLSLPFFIYDAVWFVFAVTMVLVLRGSALAGTLDASSVYAAFVIIGLVLTIAGPVLALVLWYLKRSRTEEDERSGLFASAMLRGALATFAGVAMWWLARVVLDYFRTGRFF